MLHIVNNGKAVTATNYFDSEHAANGLYFLSWNAGAGRLLVPDSRLTEINEMRTAKYVIVSRGAWAAQGGREGLELLFEDNTDSPFCLHLSAEQCDRLLPEADQGGGFEIVAWGRAGQLAAWPGKYRQVAQIPCLEPWIEQ